MSKLTIQAVKAIDSPETGQTFVWDGELRGFGVRAVPSGLKTFILQYRNSEGRSRRIVLGRYGVLTVEQARDRAGSSSALLREALTQPKAPTSVNRPPWPRSKAFLLTRSCLT